MSTVEQKNAQCASVTTLNISKYINMSALGLGIVVMVTLIVLAGMNMSGKRGLWATYACFCLIINLLISSTVFFTTSALRSISQSGNLPPPGLSGADACSPDYCSSEPGAGGLFTKPACILEN